MERHGAPKLSRKHDFQRLVSRMENNSYKSSFPPQIPPSRTRIPKSPNNMGTSTQMPRSTRAMTTPGDIYISIPPTYASNSRTPRYTPEVPRRGVFSVPDTLEKVDDDSDASSICHSPSWEDAETKKLRKLKQEVKEKRRKEKERIAKEGKMTENPTKRLSKPSPATKLSKRVLLADRSRSTPAVPSLSGPPREKGSGSKSGSMDLNGFREATNGTSGPWNPPLAELEKPVPVKSSNRFIGGLKLKMLKQTAAQERKGEQPSIGDNIRTVANGDGLGSKAETPEDTSVEAKRSSSVGKRGELFSHHSSSSMSGPRIDPPTLAETIPVVEESMRDGGKHRHLASEAMSEMSNSPPQDLIIFPISQLTGNAQRPPRSPRHSRISSQERPPISYREPLELATDVPRGRERSSSYVGHHRQQHRDTSAFDDEKRVSSATEPIHPQVRSWSIASLTRRARKSTSRTRPSTGNSENSIASNDGDNYHAFLMDNYASSQPLPNLLNRNLEEERPATSGQSKFGPATSSLRGFRNVAKATFSRHSTISTSSRKSTAISKGSNDPAAKLRTMVSNISLKSGSSKADRILGASVTSLMDARPFISSPTLGLSSHGGLNENIRPSTLGELEKELQSPSRSTTDSSEGFPDESTNASTPTGSRPESQKRSSHEAFSMSPTSPVMSGAAPYDESRRINEEDHLKTPVAKKLNSLFQFKGKGKARADQPRPSPSKKANEIEFQRHPSLSHSITIPDFQQDLSFLPELKHKSLSRTGKQEEKIPRLPIIDTRAEQSIIKSPIPGSQRPEGSSSISPLMANSSKHLQNARLNIPTAPQTRRFPNVRDAPTPMANIDPIAKMFVVCCSCRYFHDMPSKLYECMAKPDNVIEDRELGVSGLISTAVKCPWCAHGMSTACCEGYAAVVYLRERLH